MMMFPRFMIAAAGALCLVIMTLAGVRLFPHHVYLAGGLGAATGCVMNFFVQRQLYRA
jgi:hypothetical protein